MALKFYPKKPKQSNGTKGCESGGTYKRIAGDFLAQLVRNMCNHAWAYYKAARAYRKADKKPYSDHPLIKKERWIYGSLACAATSITPIVITELSVGARKKKDGSVIRRQSGRTDLFCLYLGKGNKKYEIYLELKAKSSGAKSFEKGRPLIEIKKKWNEAEEQIGRLDEYLEMQARKTKKAIRAIRIGLLIVPWMAKATEDRKGFHDGIRRHLESVSKNSLWSWSWLTPDGLKRKNPAVGFFAVVRGKKVGETRRGWRKRR